MGKTVAYIRVSTDDQQAQGTLENQRHAIALFSSGKGIAIEEWLNETQSGVDFDRPEFQKLSQGVIDGIYSTVIVAAQDRLSRSPLQTLQFIEHIQKAKATLHIIRENVSVIEGKADLASELLINMISVFAKNERETIRSRTMEGKQRKQRSGKWVTGQAPLGYELDRQTKVLKVNEAEADIIKLIFNLRMDGLGTLRIVKHLNSTQDGLYERRYEFKRSRYCKVSQKQRKAGYCRVRRFHKDYGNCPECVNQYGGVDITGTSWSLTLIKKALKNRVYLGKIKIGGEWVEAAHDTIISEPTFDRVQEMLRKEYQHPYESYPLNIFSGLIFCRCGSRMYLTHGGKRNAKDTTTHQKLRKQYWAFTCPRRKVGLCDQKNVQVAAVREKIRPIMYSLLTNIETGQVIKEAYEKILNTQDESKPDLDALRREFNEVNGLLRRLSRAYARATVSGLKEENLAELLGQMNLLQERKDMLAPKIKFFQSQGSATIQTLSEPPTTELLGDVYSMWQVHSHGPSEKHLSVAGQIIKAFISRVEIDGQEIKPVVRFDRNLLIRPLDELLNAVLRLQQVYQLFAKEHGYTLHHGSYRLNTREMSKNLGENLLDDETTEQVTPC
jgi:site-specific DNA recombinase